MIKESKTWDAFREIIKTGNVDATRAWLSTMQIYVTIHRSQCDPELADLIGRLRVSALMTMEIPRWGTYTGLIHSRSQYARWRSRNTKERGRSIEMLSDVALMEMANMHPGRSRFQEFCNFITSTRERLKRAIRAKELDALRSQFDDFCPRHTIHFRDPFRKMEKQCYLDFLYARGPEKLVPPGSRRIF